MATNLFDLSGQVALVTGASRGLGAAMSIALAQAGADVVVHGIESTTATEDAIAAAGTRAASVIADLSEPDAPRHVVAEAVRLLGRVDIIVNNAGIIRRTPAAQHADEDWDAVINLNLSTVFRMCRAGGRHMLERGSGKIVNIASLLAFQGGINVPGYAASKGGVAQLTKALANEWAGKGITVNAIAPGYMRTDNTAALQADAQRSAQILERIPAGRWGIPEDLAGAVIFLSSPASSYVNGHVLVVDGGWMGR